MGTDTVKGPPDCSCTFQLHLTCSEGFGLQKALLCTTSNHEVNALHCRLWLPWGWGVKTGKHDNGYTSGGLWALRWPSCLLTLLPPSYKSYPERFIGLTCQAFPVVFGGWSCSTDERQGDKFCIFWVTTVTFVALWDNAHSKCHNKWVISTIILLSIILRQELKEAYWYEDWELSVFIRKELVRVRS